MNKTPLSCLPGSACTRSLLLSLLLAAFSPLASPAAHAAAPAPAAGPAAAPARAPAPAAAAPLSSATSAPAAGDQGTGDNGAEPNPPGASAGGEGADTRALDQQVQDLKKDVIDLNRDLFVLEEELLFPANTQVAVFVSMDVGDFFSLDSITLKIDNRDVMNYLYTPREVAALIKGGVQRLYVGNLKAGGHELVVLFNGKGPHERYYRRGANLRFEKGVGAKYLEVKITDHERAQQPEFEIKDWE
jgi:hypothetical protein